MSSLHPLFPLLLLLLCAFVIIHAATDSSDVQSLGLFYSSLNNPPQLSGWNSNGGDPCGESWKGITCSGSSVTSIQISGLGLNGTLGYTLSDLLTLRTLDLSNNAIHDTIPYQLPPNLTYLNIANNNLLGNLPYSVSAMDSLIYLNVSHNLLSQTVGDLFTNLQNLSELDLSFNNFTGELPNSLGSLSNLSSLYLQDNQLTGQVNVLTNLNLTTLNIADNNFSGWIPKEFSSIPNLSIRGNSFANELATPPPPYDAPLSTPHASGDQGLTQEDLVNKKKLTAGQIVGIVIGSVFGVLCAVVIFVFFIRSVRRGNENTKSKLKDTLRPRSVVADPVTNEDIRTSKTTLKPLPVEKMTEKIYGKIGSSKGPKVPITATPYTVASLQTATNSFSQESLVGEGSLGRVYKGEFSHGKVLAVKKIDSAALSFQGEDNFLESVSNMSRLRHPNITTLVGYCVEHGQRLLVYEYIEKGTLHDMLHYADESSALTWNARVKVALGTARALEYLHEVCMPPIVHRNFKSANILLDEELNPHLSDCGMAVLTPNTERQISTEMVGSFGYSAPEFAMSGVYTAKSDVYSFGVVMLELLTGRKPLDSARARSEQSLVQWASPQLHDIDTLAKMVDPALNGIYPAKSLSRFADIIALCIQPEPEFRPPMSEVVQSLVRLMQRASTVRRRSSREEFGISYRIPEHEASTDLSF